MVSAQSLLFFSTRRAMDKINEYEAKLNVELSKIPQLRSLEQATGVKKTYVVLGTSTLVVFFLFFNIFAQFITNLIGFVFPAYASFKAINSKSADDDKQWLTYWTVFAAFNILETFVDLIIYWFPFFYLFKSIFFLWLYLPQTQGATLVFNSVINPYLLKNESKIDAKVESVKTKVEAVADVLDKQE